MEYRLNPFDKLLLIAAIVVAFLAVAVKESYADDYSTDWVFFHRVMHDFAFQDFRETTKEFARKQMWAGTYDRTEAFWREVYFARESGYGAD